MPGSLSPARRAADSGLWRRLMLLLVLTTLVSEVLVAPVPDTADPEAGNDLQASGEAADPNPTLEEETFVVGDPGTLVGVNNEDDPKPAEKSTPEVVYRTQTMRLTLPQHFVFTTGPTTLPPIPRTTTYQPQHLHTTPRSGEAERHVDIHGVMTRPALDKTTQNVPVKEEVFTTAQIAPSVTETAAHTTTTVPPTTTTTTATTTVTEVSDILVKVEPGKSTTTTTVKVATSEGPAADVLPTTAAVNEGAVPTTEASTPTTTTTTQSSVIIMDGEEDVQSTATPKVTEPTTMPSVVVIVDGADEETPATTTSTTTTPTTSTVATTTSSTTSSTTSAPSTTQATTPEEEKSTFAAVVPVVVDIDEKTTSDVKFTTPTTTVASYTTKVPTEEPTTTTTSTTTTAATTTSTTTGAAAAEPSTVVPHFDEETVTLEKENVTEKDKLKKIVVPLYGAETTMTTEEEESVNGTRMGSSTQDGLSSAARTGIAIGCIVGFWIILGPLVCLICKMRDKKRDKKEQEERDAREKASNHLVEEMVKAELQKTPNGNEHKKAAQYQDDAPFEEGEIEPITISNSESMPYIDADANSRDTAL